MKNKLFLFDCDGVLWKSDDNDYISSVNSDFILDPSGDILRLKDRKVFHLNKSINRIIITLKKHNYILGIVSDNKKAVILRVLKLSGLYWFFDKKAINVRLWDGYCPKHLMVQEILKLKKYKDIFPKEAVWIDDKDYSKEAKSIGVNFILSEWGRDMAREIKKS